MSDDQKFSKPVEAKGRKFEQVEKQDSERLSNAYNPARSGQHHEKPTPVHSQQVAKSAPGMNGPNPPKNAKTEMAREAHKNDMKKDAKEAETSRAQQLKTGAEKRRAQAQKDRSKDEKQL